MPSKKEIERRWRETFNRSLDTLQWEVETKDEDAFAYLYKVFGVLETGYRIGAITFDKYSEVRKELIHLYRENIEKGGD